MSRAPRDKRESIYQEPYEAHMKSIIILTADWTDEHGTLHRAGDVIAVPGYVLARDQYFGIYGKWRSPAPDERAEVGTNVLPKPPRKTETTEKEINYA